MSGPSFHKQSRPSPWMAIGYWLKKFFSNREKQIIELVYRSIPDQASRIPNPANDLSFEIGDNEKLPLNG
ncbi:hypothetical protein EM20IM_09725 [Candidatus Methylacidiphilum infernorum]|uniref:Uncharacterized protein n=1 Tax=Candidatus Methylacidiphilum infernorum TaxID=511746 RepID=A0ABX7PVF2_9BACT|nr:hypothetical protein [Candidatus Methylacidiphilum infernorum]QSR86729.1 hypothetical protein EM20IM_09725 [Candidatus Methylacidiphilum infernorum]